MCVSKKSFGDTMLPIKNKNNVILTSSWVCVYKIDTIIVLISYLNLL